MGLDEFKSENYGGVDIEEDPPPGFKTWSEYEPADYADWEEDDKVDYDGTECEDEDGEVYAYIVGLVKNQQARIKSTEWINLDDHL